MDFLYNFWSFEKVYSSTFNSAAVYSQRSSEQKTAAKNFHRPPLETYSSQPPKSNTHLTRTLRDFEKSYKNHLTRTRRFALRIFRFPTENIGKRPENATKSVSETKPPKIFRLRRQKTFYSVTEILILMVSRFFWQRGQNPLNSNTHLSRTNSWFFVKIT